jgi:hypothetical protein
MPGVHEVRMFRPLVQVVGHASKRGMIPRLPSIDQLLDEAEAFLRAEFPDTVRSARRLTNVEDAAQLVVGLHPAASDVTFEAAVGGDVALSADLPPVGPGYQTFLDRLVERLATELSIDWTPVAPEQASDADEPSSPRGRGVTVEHAAAERADAERTYLTWLGASLVDARRARNRGHQGIHIGTAPGLRYAFEGAIATVLGPRDDGWLDAAIADPRLALDVIPWWADATDARYLLNRALCLMWTDLRWRTASDDAEIALQDEVLRLLAHAFPLDPSLPYPWHEWHELAVLRGTDDAMTRQVAKRADKAAARPRIGYRRAPVTVVHEGWELEIPGTFADRRTDEEWWGGEAGRSVTVAAVETGTPDGPMSPELFLDQVAHDLGSDALTHHAGPVVGRARLGTDGSSGVEVGVLEGYSAVRGRGAAIRVVFDDSADWRWALDLWRALSPA